jgi:hypothetical protein
MAGIDVPLYVLLKQWPPKVVCNDSSSIVKTFVTQVVMGIVDDVMLLGREDIYSGLQKRCNILQFWILCSVALYGMEITLSIIEKKYSTPSWLSNELYFTQFESVVVEICPL